MLMALAWTGPDAHFIFENEHLALNEHLARYADDSPRNRCRLLPAYSSDVICLQPISAPTLMLSFLTCTLVPESSHLPNRVKPYLILTLLGLLFFGDLVLHPSSVLYSDHSDFLAMHLPLKRFLVRSWQQTGEIPLWNPYSFAGMPFLHDVQVSAFYPLHLPLYVIPEERIGAAMSWLVVFHVLIAGWCMYVYATAKRLGEMAALVAAVGYMFAGKWLLHILVGGHYIMIPLAWLPLVLLFLERGIERRSVISATWAGVFFSFIILGTHPQMTLYAGIFVALWSLGCTAEMNEECRMKNVEIKTGVCPFSSFDILHSSLSGGRASASGVSFLVRWALFGLWTALIAAALSAVQLLPALEAARESSRAAGVGTSEIYSAVPPTLMGLFGPGLSASWEDRGGLGVLWFAAALLAPFYCRGRAWFEGFVCIALAVFALGGAAVVQSFPGFQLFQLPVRMLTFLALPVALLAGRLTDRLVSDSEDTGQLRIRCRKALLACLIVPLSLPILVIIRNHSDWRSSADHFRTSATSEWLSQFDLSAQLYWVGVMITLPTMLWLLSRRCRLVPRAWGWVWFLVLLTDCWGISQTRVAVRAEHEIYAPSDCVRYLARKQRENPNEHWRVLDRGLPAKPADAPLGAALPLLDQIQLEPVLGYNSFDVRRYKEFLQFVHGEDEPLCPREGILGFPIVADLTIEHKALLDLLGVRYLLQPADKDLRFDGSGEPSQNPEWRRTNVRDEAPRAYSFLTGGMQDLPPYEVFDNAAAFPRAFKVHGAKPLADRRQVFEQLASTDFRQEVLLEGEVSVIQGSTTKPALVPAQILEYSPNRIVVATRGEGPGYLVLTDPWFPGWTCTIDSNPAEVRRANFLFRAVAVPGGSHEVTFIFAPDSYRWGKSTTLLAACVVLLLTAVWLWMFRYRPRRNSLPTRSMSASTPRAM
jgi:hypothetical protein